MALLASSKSQLTRVPQRAAARNASRAPRNSGGLVARFVGRSQVFRLYFDQCPGLFLGQLTLGHELVAAFRTESGPEGEYGMTRRAFPNRGIDG